VRQPTLSRRRSSASYADSSSAKLVLIPCGALCFAAWTLDSQSVSREIGSLNKPTDCLRLIDEIDNGLHYSVMDQLWLLLGKLAEKHDVQVIGTTHNEDLLRSSLRAFKHEPEILSLLRIDLIDGRHSIVDYDEDSRMAVLEEHFEVRG
jgi:hypothetical protein